MNNSLFPVSRLYLPRLDHPPATILDHLINHFPQIPPDAWRDRIARRLITLSDGSTLNQDSLYRHGITVFYSKEVVSEPAAPEDEVIIYSDNNIIVVDKPHGMVVTPAGDHLARSLLVRLQQRTGLPTLAPMHRLDRETAGLLLFSVDPATRGRYHQLFSERSIQREYLAVAHVRVMPDRRRWRVENRMDQSVPWYCQRIVEGPANAITEIERLNIEGEIGLFRLTPETGRKHQLRVHMASIGFPIVGDPTYPAIRQKLETEPPLQLLAWRLRFLDPISGVIREFTSIKTLQLQDKFH